MAGDEDRGYRWETEYERTWEAIKEDESGSLRTAVEENIAQRRRRQLRNLPEHVRLGMMRHLYIILDMSEAMNDQDLKPTRLACAAKMTEHFVEEYFDQNPISQLGIIVTWKKLAEKLTEMGGNPRRHIQALQGLKQKDCAGEPSLQNALNIAKATLRHMPGHSSREVLYIVGSLTTCDPGDIHQTIRELRSQNIRCSVISLSAAVHVYKSLAEPTHGEFSVVIDGLHLKRLLQNFVMPPTATEESDSALIRMGFPHSSEDLEDRFVFKKCICHLEEKGAQGSCSYSCPQCRSVYCELPIECKICGLTLVSAPHLARSYHHLFPLAPFTEIQFTEGTSCAGCLLELKAEKRGYICERCSSVFCLDCDVFLHDSVHSCPNCIT